MKISFLIHSVYGVGGTIRTTLNLAAELANRHEVEIVSVFRHRDHCALAVDPRIRLVPLLDTRPNSASREKHHPLHQRPSTHFLPSEARYHQYSQLTDERIRDHYASSNADVVIGTRPGLTACVTEFVSPRALRLGQENMTYNNHSPQLQSELMERLPMLDGLVVISESDAAVYSAQLDGSGTPVRFIPNSVPEACVRPSDGVSKTVIAAGRLAAVKQYDVLITAFARVVAARPDWQLRIYGGGDQRAELRKLIDQLRLYNHVRLMGPRSSIEPEWAKASIAVSTSRHESFGMSLVEAMRCGLPVVSTDCDYGPREIIHHGTDGLLVPVGDTKAISRALLTLIDDPELRRAMGSAALHSARRFEPDRVAHMYESFFDELTAARNPALTTARQASRETAAAAASPVARIDTVAHAPHPAGPVSAAHTETPAAPERAYATNAAGTAQTAAISPDGPSASISPDNSPTQPIPLGPEVPTTPPAHPARAATASGPSGTPAVGTIPATVPEELTADCEVRPNGDLRIALRTLPEHGNPAEATLVCLRRGADRAVDSGAIRRATARTRHAFPLDEDGAATIPENRRFAEGVWDVTVEWPTTATTADRPNRHERTDESDAEPATEPAPEPGTSAGADPETQPRSARRVPVAAGTVDLRGALGAPARQNGASPVRNLLPHPHRDTGSLTLHAWSRRVHAEVSHVQVGRGEFTVTGTLVGPTTPADSPAVLLCGRHDPTRQLTFTGERRGPDGFRCTIPATGPVARQLSRHDVWDVLLRYTPDAAPVPIGRYLDDIVEKKDVHAYPQVVLVRTGQRGPAYALRRVLRPGSVRWVRVRLFHSRRNDLALNVVDLPDGRPARRGGPASAALRRTARRLLRGRLRHLRRLLTR